MAKHFKASSVVKPTQAISKKKAKKLAQKTRLLGDSDIFMSDVSKRQAKAALRAQKKQDAEGELQAPALISTGAGTTLGGPDSHIF